MILSHPKAGFNTKVVFWLGITVLTQMSRFKQSKISLLIPHIDVLVCFVYLRVGLFFGDFWGYLRINSYSQRISKIDGNGKSGRFDVVLKVEFELQIGRRTPNS